MRNLQEWSKLIVSQNLDECGHRASKFEQLVARTRNEDELRQLWSNLLNSNETFSYLYEAVQKSRGMLTIEAIIAEYGGELGFSPEDRRTASEHLQQLKQVDPRLAAAVDYV